MTVEARARRLPGVAFEARRRHRRGCCRGWTSPRSSASPHRVRWTFPSRSTTSTRFAAIFGEDALLGLDEERGEQVLAHLAPAVRAFFRNGGRRAWIVRVASPAAVTERATPSRSRRDRRRRRTDARRTLSATAGGQLGRSAACRWRVARARRRSARSRPRFGLLAYRARRGCRGSCPADLVRIRSIGSRCSSSSTSVTWQRISADASRDGRAVAGRPSPAWQVLDLARRRCRSRRPARGRRVYLDPTGRERRRMPTRAYRRRVAARLTADAPRHVRART